MASAIIILTLITGGILTWYTRNSMEDPAVHRIAVPVLSAVLVFFLAYAIFDEVHRFRLLMFAIFSAAVLAYRIWRFKQVSTHGS